MLKQPVLLLGDCKNPRLDSINSAYNFNYITPYYDLIIGALNKEDRNEAKNIKPFLLETLMYSNDNTLNKIRKLDILNILFNFEKIKEAGNKYYNNNEYLKALMVYIRALSLLKYYKFLDNKSTDIVDYLLRNRITINEIICIEKECCNKEDDKLKQDMLCTIEILLSTCMMKLNFFETSEQILYNLIPSNDSSIIYFKYCQALSKNMSNNITKLITADNYISKMFEIYNKEAHFKDNSNLKFQNLEDIDDIYNNLRTEISEKNKNK